MKLGEATLAIRPKLLPFPSLVGVNLNVVVNSAGELDAVLDVLAQRNLIEGATVSDTDPFAGPAPADLQPQEAPAAATAPPAAPPAPSDAPQAASGQEPVSPPAERTEPQDAPEPMAGGTVDVPE